MKILITGATGMLGQNLFYLLNNKYELYLTGKRKNFNKHNKYLSFDFLEKEIYQKKNFFRNFVKPDLIIHSGGLTNLDYCEVNQKEAFDVNSESVNFLSSTYPNDEDEINCC